MIRANGLTSMTGLCLGRRHILLRRGRPFAEEILLHLFHDRLLVLTASRIQAILVQQHFAELRPTPPGFLGDVFINLLPEFRVKRRFIQTRKFLAQLDAENCALSHRFSQELTGKLSHTEGRAGTSQRNSRVAANAPKSCATIKAGVSAGRMPAKVLVAERASVTAGFAKEVDAVNQYAAVI